VCAKQTRLTMKKNHSKSMAALVGGAALFMATPNDAHAQAVGNRVAEAFAFMNEGKIEQAYAAFKGITEDYGEERGYKLFSGRYGELWYMRGYTAMKLGARAGKAGAEEDAKKLYDEATKAFEVCNKLKGDPKKSVNRYANKAVLMLGNVEQKLGKFKEAIEKYHKFVKNINPRNKKDKYDKGMMRINLAICHFSMEKPEIDKGMEHFQAALENKEKLKVQDAAVVATFQAMSAAIIKEKKEAKMVDFVRDHRATLTLEPYEMYDYVPLFLKLSSDALKEKMNKACVSLLTLLPSTQLCDQDFKSVLGAYQELPGVKLGDRVVFKEAVEKNHERLKAAKAKPKIHEYIQFQIMAFFHEANGNVRGAFGVYEQLELYHQNCPDREENLYNLVRTANNIGEIFKTEEYGQIFLKAFPKSEHCETVERLMLHSLFFNGEYEKCVQVAQKLIDGGLTGPSKQHDVALHCLGGSYYYLGQAVKAAPLLEEHVKMYGKGTKNESEYMVASEYFNASNDTYIEEYERAAVKLDKFLKDFPEAADNPFLSNAKYDRANCHFAANESEPALKHLGEVIKDFPTCAVLDKAWALKGNVEQNDEDLESAEVSYKKALEICQSRKNEGVEQEVLYYLVGLLGVESIGKKPNPKIKDAVPYYDLFWKKFQQSPYKTQVAAAGVPPLRAVNRGKEALGNLQAVITEMAHEKDAPGLEAAINTYSKEYLKEKGNTPEKLIEHYRTFPGVGVDQVRARALLSMGIVGVMTELKEEAEAKKAKDSVAADLVLNYQAKIDAQYQFLKTINISKLSNFILVSVGRSILDSDGADPAAASRYFEQVIKNSKEGKFAGLNQAYFGLAEIGAKSTDRNEQSRALAALESVYAKDQDDKKTQEKALALMVELSRAMGENQKAIEYGQKYLEQNSFRKNRLKVRFNLGLAYRASRKIEDAIAQLGSILGPYKGVLKYSAPACKAVMEMTWARNAERGGKQDRQVAYELGRSYFLSLAATVENNSAKIPRSEKKAYQAVGDLYRQYEESGEVTKKEDKKPK